VSRIGGTTIVSRAGGRSPDEPRDLTRLQCVYHPSMSTLWFARIACGATETGMSRLRWLEAMLPSRKENIQKQSLYSLAIRGIIHAVGPTKQAPTWYLSGKSRIAPPRSPFPPSWPELRSLSMVTLKAKQRVTPAIDRRNTMGNKLYVGNLSYDVSSSDLEQMFSPHCTVESAQVIEDRGSGRSKGFGFVEMASSGEAQAAIDALNGRDHSGRALTVNEAKPREARGGGGYGGGRGYGRDR
jgi:cold-inducible RNA-binding protein